MKQYSATNSHQFAGSGTWVSGIANWPNNLAATIPSAHFAA
jgi:hypothetical protein